LFAPLAEILAIHSARAVPKHKKRSFQRITGGSHSQVRKTHHAPPHKIGNFHRLLQVRYCSATLIIDERMQIYYEARHDSAALKELPVR